MTPRTGRELWRWAREVEDRERVGLVKLISAWARLQGYPSLWLDWTPEQVAKAYEMAVNRLGW